MYIKFLYTAVEIYFYMYIETERERKKYIIYIL